MNILALETSSSSGSVALLDDARPCCRLNFPAEQRTARTFAACLAQALESAGWQPNQIDLVAVTRGPGSFTGLRIGITAAKTLAYATDAEVLGIDTLEAIAAQSGPHRNLVVVLDAQRQQLFQAAFDTTGRTPKPLGETQIVAKTEWLRQRRSSDVLTGSGLASLRDDLAAHATMVDVKAWQPRAETIGRLAYYDYQAGRRDDLWKLSPVYLRQSAAEEKLAGKQGKATQSG